MSLPVSTSQAIVGAIIGWNFYTSNPTDLGILTKIVTTWVSGPILGGVFAILLFMLVKKLTKKSSIHLLYRDSFIRYGLLAVGAFGAYSLGANNIANVMGVFTGAVDLPVIDLGIVQFSSTQQLFFIGGIAIAIGITTYSKHIMETVGNSLMPLTPEAAIVVVLSQALVLFIFSSQGLSNAIQSIGLPAIPLVPVSSSQVVIGSIIGIGLYKGGKEIKYNILGSISLGWVATPIVAGIIAFFMLFFVNNVFQKDVGGDRIIERKIEVVDGRSSEAVSADDTLALNNSIEEKSDNDADYTPVRKEQSSKHDVGITAIYFWVGLSITFIIILALLYYIWMKRKKVWLAKHKLKSLEEKYLLKIESLEKSLKDKIHRQDDLGKELKFRQSEMVTMAMSIIRKNEFLNDLKSEIVKIKANIRDQEIRLGLNKLSLMITQDLSIDRDREKFQMHINEQNSNFIHQLTESFPTMTDNEKRLASLLRLNLSSKEIASILNISPKSVEMNRYRLRKKLKVNPKVSLSDFIRNFL